MLRETMNSDALPRTAFPVDKHFQPIVHWPIAPFIAEAEAIERRARIEVHPFFEYAKNQPDALSLWASQEAVVTNPFSQILLRVIARIANVHVRSLLMPVVDGEHSSVRGGSQIVLTRGSFGSCAGPLGYQIDRSK
ncbi:hypothetical protein ACQ5SK_28575 [Bradyrhizobium japonicum]